MSALRRQRTIAHAAAVDGFGYFRGQDVRVEFRAAAAGRGLTFVRCDLSPAARIPAQVAYRIDTPRRTSLEAGGARVEMVEHILAALSGLAVDNCEIWVDAPEMPGCDGSARAFVDALNRAGFESQHVPAKRIVVQQTVRVGGHDAWIQARPTSADHLTIEYQLEYGSRNPIGKQFISMEVTPQSFLQELADSRTFLLDEEARWLMSQGLGARVTPRDLLIFDQSGPVGNTLRFADECVRHKVLDVVGDLALAGCEIVGHIVACRSGHQLNAELVAALLLQAQEDVPQARCA